MGWWTDGPLPWIVNQSVHQDGSGICISGLIAGDAEPPVVDEALLEQVDQSVATLIDRAPPGSPTAPTRDPPSLAVVRPH